MTVILDERYEVTVRGPEKIGPREWTAEGAIYERGKNRVIKRVTGRGSTKTSASNDAVSEARAEAARM